MKRWQLLTQDLPALINADPWRIAAIEVLADADITAFSGPMHAR